ncbi:Uncharacterised protein [Mycobacteroides abscessus subsp. massiliense]|nr:Uncharacterised protein [Mycobacteroides abscessus subsp. massiliense]
MQVSGDPVAVREHSHFVHRGPGFGVLECEGCLVGEGCGNLELVGREVCACGRPYQQQHTGGRFSTTQW